MAQGSRLPCKEGVRVGVMPNALTFLSTGTGEPDAVKVARPVRRGAGRKGGLTDLARGLPDLLRRSRFRQQLRPGVRPCTSARCSINVASFIRVALTTIRIRRWPVHRRPVCVTLLLLLASACGVLTGPPVVPVWAQGSAWTKVPTIVVVTPEHDHRLP